MIEYISTTGLVKELGLAKGHSLERGKKLFYELCGAVGWGDIHITAAAARANGVNTDEAPRDWYYPKQKALALWRKFQKVGGR